MEKLKAIFAAFATALMLGLPIALAASATYYAKTTVYFNIPSDATFSIALPADYASWTEITGTSEGAPTATDWISFNFTSASQAALQEPQQLGVAANIQAGNVKPIFYIDNTGNVVEKFEIKYSADPAAGISLFWNTSCTGTCAGTPTETLTNMTDAYAQVIDQLQTDEYLNTTLYSNTSLAVSGGQTTIDVYIKSTAV